MLFFVHGCLKETIRMLTTNKRLLASSLAAIGIIYGDLGTSPLYAFRESLKGLPITPGNIYAVLSLFFGD
jgi:KUP system potassium uptake protein